MNRSDLGPEALAAIAQRFRLLGEVSRLRLLIALERGERTVTELIAETGLNQANVSRHLNALSAGGVLRRRREGLHIYYAIGDPSIFQLCETVCGSLKTVFETRADVFTHPRDDSEDSEWRRLRATENTVQNEGLGESTPPIHLL